MVNPLTGYIFGKVTGAGEIDESKCDEYMDNTWNKIIPVIEKRLNDNGGKPFIAGTDRPTIADFKCFQTLWSATDMNPACIMPAHTQGKVVARIAESAAYSRWVDTMKQELASYIAQRPPRPL